MPLNINKTKGGLEPGAAPNEKDVDYRSNVPPTRKVSLGFVFFW